MDDRAVGAGARDGGEGNILEPSGIAAKAFERFDSLDLAERTARCRALEPRQKTHDRGAVAPVRRAGARDLDGVFHRLHQHDRVGTAAELAARAGDQAGERIGSRCLIDAHRLLGRTQGGEIARKVGRLAHIGERLQAVTHVVGELAAVDIEGRAALPRDDRKGERQRRVRDVGAADIEGPGDTVGIRDHERVGLELADLRANARQLGDRLLARKGDIVQPYGAERRRRTIRPDRIEQIGLDRDQRRPARPAGLGEPLGALDGVQPRVIAKTVVAGEVLFQPLMRRGLDQVLDRKQRRVHLLAHLQGVAAIDEQRRTVHEHDGRAGGTGEARQPSQPLVGGRHVFVLLAIGARHDEAGQSAMGKLGPQRLDARRAGRPLGSILERLEARLEHGRHSMGHAGGRQRFSPSTCSACGGGNGRGRAAPMSPSRRGECGARAPLPGRGRPRARHSPAPPTSRKGPRIRAGL